MARNNENPEAAQANVVDSEDITVPAGGTNPQPPQAQEQPAQAQQPQQAQQPAQEQQPQQAEQPEARSTPEQQEAQQVSGPTSVKYVGRGAEYSDGENTYEHGQVVEVDANTANRLLSAKDARGQQQFVQAD